MLGRYMKILLFRLLIEVLVLKQYNLLNDLPCIPKEFFSFIRHTDAFIIANKQLNSQIILQIMHGIGQAGL